MKTTICSAGRRFLTVVPGLCLLSPVVLADHKRPLSDAELDQITAGSVEVNEQDELLKFEASRKTARGSNISVDGSLKLIEIPAGITIGDLNLTDNAQQNLQSLININAVNSAVNVLLNLNVTIDSSVGSINQVNLSEVLPGPLLVLPGN